MLDEHVGGSADRESATARLSAFGSLEGTELAGLAQIAGPVRLLDPGDILWDAGKRLPALFILLDGWMISTVGAGIGRGVTVKVHLPGDVLGLPSLAFSEAAETTVALTPAKVRPLGFHSFGHLFEAYPRVAAMMFLVSQQERMLLMDRLVAAHIAGAKQRLATFFWQMLERVQRSYPGTADSFFLPIERDHVADLIGVGPSQLAAAVKELRRADIVGWTGGWLTVLDAEALRTEAGLPARQLASDAHWLPLADGPTPGVPHGSDRSGLMIRQDGSIPVSQ